MTYNYPLWPFAIQRGTSSVLLVEHGDECYDRSDDGTTPSSADYEDHYARYDEEDYEEQEFIAENERLEEEYIRYFTRQCSLPDHYEDREHGASF